MSEHKVIVLHLREKEPYNEQVELLGAQIDISHVGCDGDLQMMAKKAAEFDGKVDAIVLHGVAKELVLGKEKTTHRDVGMVYDAAQKTPIVDGSGVRDAMERWAMLLAAQAQPGIWSRKRTLMAPGINHAGLTKALEQYTDEIAFADPVIYFNLPATPSVGSKQMLGMAAAPTLGRMQSMPFQRLFPKAGVPNRPRNPALFEWAQIIAGNIGSIRRYAPKSLKGKIVVVESATEEDIADLTERDVSILVTTMPPLGREMAHLDGAIFEGCLAALRPDKNAPLTKNAYLNLMAELEWQPAVKYLQPDEANINRFAFVIHPLSLKFIHAHPQFKLTKHLPDNLVERFAAEMPPMYVSRIKGIESPTTGQKVEGILLTLGATPKEFMRRDVGFTYRRLIKAARIAEQMGARLMGLGAFTSVVGDAGITVAQKSDIAITSGNSLTVSATLETAKEAMVKMGHKLENSREGNVMVIGATGSIGAVCSRLLAQAVPNITLVAPRPEKLIALKRQIEEETPYANVRISANADDYLGEADLIVTTTTAIGQRIIDILKCKPGAVICDIARPPDITEEEADLRPDVLVIESGEILLPGDPDFGYNIGLPPGVAYACLAETALLALEGKFEDFTLGRNLEIDKVKEIYRLYKKHQLQLSGIRSHGHFLTDDDLAEKRRLADELRHDPERLAQLRQEGEQKLAKIDAAAQRSSSGSRSLDLTTAQYAAAGAAALGMGYFLARRRNRGKN